MNILNDLRVLKLRCKLGTNLELRLSKLVRKILKIIKILRMLKFKVASVLSLFYKNFTDVSLLRSMLFGFSTVDLTSV